jgi:RsmE family RNA methyltransferase
MNLLVLTDSDIVTPNRFRVTGPRHLHILSILKPEVGDTLSIGILNGARGLGRILAINADETIIESVEMTDATAPVLSVDLICAIPRPKILRKVLYVAAMFGVRSIHLVRTNRTEKSYLLSPLMDPHKQLPFLLEGLSQGEWTRLPVVEVHPLFRPFVEDILPSLPGYAESPRLLADLVEGSHLDQIVPARPASQLFLGIGPEGGWVDFERILLRQQGFTSFSLGKSNLRVEYALAAALAQLELLNSRSI